MSTRQTSNWVSLSDMMTGLMLIFLLISILTISHVVQRESERNELVKDFENTKSEMYDELVRTFGGKQDEWGIEITKDLSIKFENPDVLFDYLSSEITPEFQSILDEFIPKYVAIVNNPKYSDKIKEVRIEGHTADWDDYLYTIELSQDRSNAVLAYILESEYFKSLSAGDRDKIKFWFTSNGLGNGRTIDDVGEYTFYSEKTISAQSRRVEFRIVTTSDELVEQIVNNLKQQ
jgi:outer membrane protein OmpA-like peptidoglycan-associated protein